MNVRIDAQDWREMRFHHECCELWDEERVKDTQHLVTPAEGMLGRAELAERIEQAKALVSLARRTVAAARNHRHTAVLRREIDKLMRPRPIWTTLVADTGSDPLPAADPARSLLPETYL